MKKIITDVVTDLIRPIFTLAFAWIPMLCWNYGLHSVFPQIPTVTYMQIFTISLLVGHIFSRPQFNTINRE